MAQQSPQVYSLDLNHDKDFQFNSSATDVEQPSEPKIEQSSPKSPTGLAPPPNGGLVAWLQVVGGFMLFFNNWGIVNAFGVFQSYYESGALFDRIFVGYFMGRVYSGKHVAAGGILHRLYL